MGEQIAIDADTFHDRLSSFINKWKNDKRGESVFGGVGSIVLCVGKASDMNESYPKPAAFQLWLLGYEFPATLIVLTQEGIHFVTTKKKAEYLEKLKNGKVQVDVQVRTKNAEENTAQFQKCLETVKTSGKKVGVVTKDNAVGPFAEEWKTNFAEISKDVEQVDISQAISAAGLAIKDEKELRIIRDAARASSGVLVQYFVEEMSKILDEEKRITHQVLSDKVGDVLDNQKFFSKVRVSNTFDHQSLDWAYNPVVQSGGNYDLKFTGLPDDKTLHAGVIVCALGLRYHSYASLVARTYMVDPTKAQESNYKVLLLVHDTILKAIKDGALAKEVYNKALAVLKSKKPNLERHFVKSVGYGIGIESKDSTIVINGKSSRPIKDGMTLTVVTGFADLDNPDGSDKRSKNYSLVLADTIRVHAGDAATTVFTKDAPSDLESTTFFFKDDDEPTPKKPSAKRDSRIGAVAQQNITSTRLRKERTANHDAEKEAHRREHQKQLHERKQQQGLELYSNNKKSLNGTEEKKFKRFESYKRDNQFPTKVKDMGIVMDQRNSTIIVPIMGRPVPFHINTIKNASSTAEGEYTSLRINFLSPGQGIGRKDDQPFEDPTAHFVRSLTFRSIDGDRMAGFATSITDMKKESVRREQEKKQLEDVVEQDKLLMTRRPDQLEMVFLRPPLDNKREHGKVEIHQNGIRYVHGLRTDSGGSVDVLFNNVKHLFFQPSKSELIVVIHLHLINPIMIGKRKTKDVQFYRDATDMQFDETGNRKRRHRHDEDEMEAEQEERRRRAQLDKEFLAFAKKVEDAGRDAHLKVDMPYRDLGFNGVHSRSNVFIQPTTDCIVQLIEMPFLVITIDDIEIVHLERVAFGLKNFDMVVVFKDFTRNPQHINTIPMESIEAVKDWMDSIELAYYEGNLNLQWPTIMKTVQADPYTFFKEGGWKFLSNESDSEDDVEEEEEESAFEISDSELAAASEESSDEDSDFDENASEEASAEEDESDVSEAPDWDEHEKIAKKKDRDRGDEDEDDRRPAKGGRKRKR